MKNALIALALIAGIVATPAHANRNTEAALLGVIAGGVIVGLANQGRSHHHHHHHHHGAPQGVINGGWNHPGPANLHGVCAITSSHQGQWIEVIHRNCHGDIILIERLPRW